LIAGADEVAAIERATLTAMAPETVQELAGWLVPLDHGVIGRAKSAVPLRHDLPKDEPVLAAIEALYEGVGLAPAFRMADAAALGWVGETLVRRGYRLVEPTLVMVGDAAELAVLSEAPAELAAAPDESWTRVFQGEGFAAEDSAARLRNLIRSPATVFVSVREDGEALAVGAGTFAEGWACVHAMRTRPSRRGEGLAARVLAAIGRAALERRISRVFLQVEEPNTGAIALYLRAGLAPAWRYHYWRLP
jgi:GNAT superfamily N-acetyltransferase